MATGKRAIEKQVKSSLFLTEMNIIKEKQKARAIKIRHLKDQRKKVTNGYVPELRPLQQDYRDYHVAYSELRGRDRVEIEARPYDYPDEFHIRLIKRGVLRRSKQ